VWFGLASLYGTKFTNPFGVSPHGPTGDMWRAALAGLGDAQLRHGLRALVTAGDKFAPTAPEFRALCLDVLELNEVRADLARKNEERHPFTRMVWACMDVRAFTLGNDYTARDALAGAYAMARKARMEGDPLPEGGQYALPASVGLPSGNTAAKDRADPSKMTRLGQQLVAELAREIHPQRKESNDEQGS
jgi:hypothetical protein